MQQALSSAPRLHRREQKSDEFLAQAFVTVL